MKLRRRRGRPRKPGPRTPSGRLSRSAEARDPTLREMTEREALSVGLDARVRVYGVTPELAEINRVSIGKPNAGTVIGRWALAGVISAEEYEAAVWYAARREDWLRAIQAPGRLPTGRSYDGDDDSQDYADWCDKVRDRWAEIRAALWWQRPGDCGTQVRPRVRLLDLLDAIIVRDESLPEYAAELRTALGTLYRVFLG